MTDLSLTIAPKSDQLNADDLIGGPRTIRITKVSANPDSAEQPISIYFDGDNDKPYKPCKSMRRVLVQVWGKDGNAYPGRSMTLYRDPKVLFGGLAVGGIRISHMSNIEHDVTMALTATRAARKPFTVRPLVEAAKKRTIADAIDELEIEFNAAVTREDVETVRDSEKCKKALDYARNGAKQRLDGIVAAALERTAPAADEGDWPSADAAEG